MHPRPMTSTSGPSCRHGGRWGFDLDGGQGDAVRVPQAQGTLLKLPVGEDSAGERSAVGSVWSDLDLVFASSVSTPMEPAT